MNLKSTLFLLPNAITAAGVYCGFESIRLTSEARSGSDFFRAALFIVFAMIADTLDGRVARATKTQSAFGLQLDSLADVVAFGVAPALLAYHWSLRGLGPLGAMACFLYVACGAIRLARFNVLSMRKEEKEKAGVRGNSNDPGPRYILGLPIPGAAGVVVSLVLTQHAASTPSLSKWIVLAIMFGASAFMVSTLRFRSFKDVRPTLGTAAMVIATIATSAIVSIYLRPTFVLVWLLGCWVAVALIETAISSNRRLAQRARRLLANRSPKPKFRSS